MALLLKYQSSFGLLKSYYTEAAVNLKYNLTGFPFNLKLKKKKKDLKKSQTFECFPLILFI